MNTKEQEMQMWRDWKDSSDPEVFEALMTSMDPLVQKRVNQFQGAPMPRSAIEAEARKQVKKALETYDPTRGAALGTHASNYLQKVYRYVSTYQNVGRMPESRTIKINTYSKTKDWLAQIKGREPTPIEMADELGWSVREVGRMERELRKDLGLETSFGEVSFLEFDKNADILNYGYYELGPDEQLVFDYSIGMHGKPKLTMNQIAKNMGKTPRQVGLIKQKIVTKLRKYQ